MMDFMKRVGTSLISIGSGFAAGLAAAALVSRTGLVELGDADTETEKPAEE